MLKKFLMRLWKCFKIMNGLGMLGSWKIYLLQAVVLSKGDVLGKRKYIIKKKQF